MREHTRNVDFASQEPPHQLTVCVTGGGAYVGLTISHALVDAHPSRFCCVTWGSRTINTMAYLLNTGRISPGSAPLILPRLDHQSLDEECPKETRTVEVDIDGAAELEQFCAQEGVTVSTVFQFAWALVLRCFAQTGDVCFGYLTAGRDIALDDLEDAVGPYINTLVTRVHFGRGQAVREELQAILNDFIKNSPHQHAPLGRFLSGLNLSGPLFNTAISVRRTSSHMAGNASSLGLKSVWELSPTEYDLTANVFVSSISVHISLSYWTSTCSEEQAMNFTSTLQRALGMIVSHPDTPPEQLDLFSEHNHAYVERLNARACQRFNKVTGCVHHLVGAQVKVQPQAPAVCAWDGDFTYGELDHRASLLAIRLIQRGAGPKVFIPIHTKRSKWTLVALLAVVKAEAAFILFDPSRPQSGLQAMCEDSRATIIISSELLKDRSKQLCPSVVVIGESTASTKTPIASPYISPVEPSNALLAVFTSGSTGKPKGIIIQHSSFYMGAPAWARVLNLTNRARVLAFASFTFDMSIAELLMTLCLGGCVCIPSEEERLNDLAGAINRPGVNTMLITPSVLRLLDPKQAPNVHTVKIGGEPVYETDFQRWAEHCTLIEGYGPAECCIYAFFQPQINCRSDPSNIGYPTQRLPWLPDPTDPERLAPVGSVGELLLEGPAVGREYLNQPDKTAEVFIPPPPWPSRFSFPVQGGFYKTGDLVRYGSDGTVRFVGRKGTQVKINGQRMELGEAEHHLRRYLGHSIDVVVGLVHFNGTSAPPTLTAFLRPNPMDQRQSFAVFKAGLPSMVSSLKAHLWSSLPRYMVPMAYVPLPDFPTNKSMKTDRSQLRELAIQLSQEEMAGRASEEKTPPRTAREQLIQKLVSQVLDLPVDQVGLNDNFFMLGGDSSHAIKLVSLARGEGLSLSVKDILKQPVLMNIMPHEDSPELVAAATAPTSNISVSSATQPCGLLGINDAAAFICDTIAPQIEFTADSILDVLPTTEFQAECILDWPLSSFLATMHGPLDKTRLRAACQLLVERHEIYRTVYVRHGPATLQVVLRQIPLPFSEMQYDEGQDLDMYDGYSLATVFRDLSALYEDIPLDPVTNYSAYILYLASQSAARAQAFWSHTLKDSPPPIHLQHLSLGAEPEDHTGGTLIGLSEEISLPKLPPTITPATLMKAATALLLMCLTNERDLVFGQLVSGRTVPLAGVESILGVCANIVPVRVKVHPKHTVLDLLQKIQTQHIDAIEYETTGMCEIRRACPVWPENAPLGCLIQHQNVDVTPQFALGPVECSTRMFGGEFKRQFLHVVTSPRGNRTVVQIFAPS
ncbi:acetyl-CoA synthetase-like protein [Aspergillus novofumigatus IBT 16806]|uniref:Acetyl-CoA synthetase-like protein n=1 Tax=Aspergillus novofumigatus (strain IBT 16806) TaxID=1392255 RepID=A0A2I1BX34_ASPN1|nr:acetyl-CoA synthetase-like protein [Aspergillus novofumigatus IBT 16806]PKX89955.1 acetyl-CoA synthetase-like protein [Aspergillus novofumigatus IBT 16806]